MSTYPNTYDLTARLVLALDHDCQGFFGQLEELVDDGYVERIGWRQLEGFRTTSKGSTRAKHIVTEHLEAAKNRINSGLGQIPRKVLQFIIWEIMNVDELRFGYSGRIDHTPENSSTSK